jgi:hypothetical protein
VTDRMLGMFKRKPDLPSGKEVQEGGKEVQEGEPK